VEEDYEPRAVRAAREGWLEGRVQQVELETAFKPSFQLLRPSALVMPCTAPPQAVASLASCLACPRNCAVDRLQDKRGACNTGRKAIVSSAFPHFGEESVLQGWNGSGTVFFGMCNLRCVFCQNWDISQKKNGWELQGEEIADLMLKLQNETGCHNINFVTPEHVVPQVGLNKKKWNKLWNLNEYFLEIKSLLKLRPALGDRGDRARGVRRPQGAHRL